MPVTRTYPVVSKSTSSPRPYTVLMFIVAVKDDVPDKHVLHALKTILDIEKNGEAGDDIVVTITLYSATAKKDLETVRITGSDSRSVTLPGLQKHASKSDVLWHLRVSVSDPNVSVTLHGLQMIYDKITPQKPDSPVVVPDKPAPENNKDSSMELVNSLRRRHQAQPLTRDATVERSAQAWADHLARSVHRLQHSSSGYGENLYWTSQKLSREDAEKQAVRAWYSEVSDFDWANPTANFEKVGHLTCLVWRATKRTGFGVAYDTRNGSTYVCAQYDPPGNFWNRHDILENVKPAIPGL